MDKLSPEIFKMILHYLSDKEDLASFRLVQRSFAGLANEFYFTIIPLEPYEYGLSNIVAISRRPDIAPYVKEVILGADRDVGRIIWPEFNEKLELENITHGDQQHAARASELLQSCVDEYYDFQTSPDYIATLSATFARLPRLGTITVAGSSPRAYRVSSQWEEMDRYTYKKPAGYRGWCGSRDMSRAFVALVNAAYHAGSIITSFHGGEDCDGDELSQGIGASAFQSAEFMRRAGVVFSNCKVISIYFSSENSDLCDALERYPLFGLLSKATQLERLTLHFDDAQPERMFSRLFTDAEDQVWPCLKFLSIGVMTLKSDELVAFLGRHKKSLRSIEFIVIDLRGANWAHVGRFIRENLQLEKIYFNSLRVESFDGSSSFDDQPHTMALVEYALGRGSDDPGAELFTA